MLEFQFGFPISQGKHPQFAGAPVPSGADDVRQEQSKATIIVQPVDVDDTVLLLAGELRQLVQDVLGQFCTTRAAIEQSRIVVGALQRAVVGFL